MEGWGTMKEWKETEQNMKSGIFGKNRFLEGEKYRRDLTGTKDTGGYFIFQWKQNISGGGGGFERRKKNEKEKTGWKRMK